MWAVLEIVFSPVTSYIIQPEIGNLTSLSSVIRYKDVASIQFFASNLSIIVIESVVTNRFSS